MATEGQEGSDELSGSKQAEASGQDSTDAGGNSTGSGGNSTGPDEAVNKRKWPKRLGIIFGLVVLYFLTTFVDVWFASRRVSEDLAEAAVVLGAAQ